MNDFATTLDPVLVEIEVLLGETKMPVHQLLRMGRGAIIELAGREDQDLLVLANDVPIAKAQVVVDGGQISIEITKMLPRQPRAKL
jgi:flagellar motor switch protein FliN/FliY